MVLPSSLMGRSIESQRAQILEARGPSGMLMIWSLRSGGLLPADAVLDDYHFGRTLGRTFRPALDASDRCFRSKETNWRAPRSDAAAT